MKVLIANYRYFVSSGPERYLFNITRHLEDRGHTVMPFSVTYSRNLETPYAKYFVPPIGGPDEVYFDQHRKTPATVLRTLSRLFYSPEVEKAIGRMVDETQPDVAYVLYYLRKLSPSLLVGLRKRGIPIVARISDYGMFCPELHCLRDEKPCTLCLGGNSLHSVRHRCVKGSFALSAMESMARSFHHVKGYFDLIDQFVATNPFMLEMMIKAGYPRERLTCIPTFTDVEKFSPQRRAGEPDYLVCVGRLDRPKGINVLIDAMARLRPRLERLPVLKIAGAGHTASYVESLKQQAADAGLGDQVQFLGNVEAGQIPDLLRGAICAVMPALWFENLPNTLIESMACGTPVVASDIGSLATAVSDGIDGLLARSGDAADLADKLERLISDRALRVRLSEGARQAATTRYSPKVHVDTLVGLLDAMVAHRQAAAIPA
ncbi:MAG: glycosyltransferase family 4 protein [Panacagrimonas sp.]